MTTAAVVGGAPGSIWQRAGRYLAVAVSAAVFLAIVVPLVWWAPWKARAFGDVGTWGALVRCGDTDRFVHTAIHPVGLILLDRCSEQYPAGTVIDTETRQIVPPVVAPQN